MRFSNEVVTLLLMFALLAASVITDLRSRKIPNRLVLIGLSVALALHAFSWVRGAAPSAGAALWAPLAGLLAGGALLMPLYLIRACGAGDVKLMAMVGAFIGPSTVVWAVLYTLIAGGVLSLFVMFAKGIARTTLDNTRYLLTDWILRLRTGSGARLEPLATTAFRLPYAVAISFGTLAAAIARQA